MAINLGTQFEQMQCTDVSLYSSVTEWDQIKTNIKGSQFEPMVCKAVSLRNSVTDDG